MYKKKNFVEKVWIEDTRKLVKNFLSERNNAVHFASRLPEHCRPSGMDSHYQKVVIKDYETMQYIADEIDKKLDLLLDHIEMMKEDLGEL